MKLILGSSSKYRKELLETAGYVFDIMHPDLDEKSIETNDPYERPLILARAKADVLLNKINEPALILTSDTVVIAGGVLCEKPESLDEARKFLDQYRNGIAPETVSAVVVTNTKTGERFEAVDKGTAFFKYFPDSMIEDFILHGEPLTRAGGFAIQHPIMRPYIDKIEGSEESIIGVPMHLFKELLIKAGY